jgi:GAF domain-containing protein
LESETALRELLAVREIAHAFQVAERPEHVHQFALDRVTPLLGAAFSLVMELGEDGELLRPVAQHEWPARHRAWIGALRVRVGSGPSGLAVAERRLVEVADLFADPALTDWYDVARELGFRSIVAAPLLGRRSVIGAIAFYFADETRVSEEQRALVRLVADQLAATVEKAALIDDLRRANAALAEANAELERVAAVAEAARASRDRFIEGITSDIGDLLGEGSGAPGSIERAAELARLTRDLVRAERGELALSVSDIDPRAPLLEAVASGRLRQRTIPIVVAEPTAMLPTVRTDARWLQRLLELGIAFAATRSPVTGANISVAVELGRGFVAHRVAWFERGDGENGQPSELTLAQAMARHLGGEMQLERASAADGDELTLTLIFPVEVRT